MTVDVSTLIFSHVRAQYGKFCKGDSYLVLKTTQTGGGAYEWDLHFWLGAESSVDEVVCFRCCVYSAICTTVGAHNCAI